MGSKKFIIHEFCCARRGRRKSFDLVDDKGQGSMAGTVAPPIKPTSHPNPHPSSA